MALQTGFELDDIYETLGLLYFGACAEIKKADVIAQLNHLSMNGPNYYDLHFKVVDRYIDAFQEHRVATAADELFFEDGDHGLFLILAAILCAHRELLDGADSMEESALRGALARLIRGTAGTAEPQTETLANIVDLLNEKKLSDGSKWKLSMLLLRPKQYLREFANALEQNGSAYRQARQAVQKQLDHLLQQYETALREGKDKSLARLGEKLAPEAKISPALVTPLMIMLPTHSHCYYGLLHEKTLRDAEKHQLVKNFCCYN